MEAGSLAVAGIQLDNGSFTMTLIDSQAGIGEVLYNAAQADGSELPEWLAVDPATGTITGHPPEGVTSIQVRIMATDADGKVRTLNVTVNFQGQ